MKLQPAERRFIRFLQRMRDGINEGLSMEEILRGNE